MNATVAKKLKFVAENVLKRLYKIAPVCYNIPSPD